MTLWQYYNFRSSEDGRYAQNYLDRNSVFLVPIIDEIDYYMQEKACGNGYTKEVLRRRIENLKEVVLKEYLTYSNYKDLKKALDLFCNWLLEDMERQEEISLSSVDISGKNISYIQEKNKMVDYSFKFFLKDTLKSVGVRKSLNNDAFLQKIIVILEDVMEEFYYLFEDAFYDKDELGILKRDFRDVLKGLIKVQHNGVEEIITINEVNNEKIAEDITSVITMEDIRNFGMMYYKKNTLTFNEKNGVFSLVVDDGYFDYVYDMNKVHRYSKVKMDIYDENFVMQGDYGFESDDILENINFSKSQNIISEYRLVNGYDGYAHYVLKEMSEEIITLDDVEIVYDTEIINTLNFEQLDQVEARYYLNIVDSVNFETKLLLNKEKVRYLFPYDDKRFSVVVRDFSIDKMWEVIKEKEEMARVQMLLKRKNGVV